MYILSSCMGVNVGCLLKTWKEDEAVEMWCSRRIMRMSWTERKTSEKVIEMARYKRSLLKITRARSTKFFGHTIGAGGMEKQLLCGKVWGMKSRRRQGINYTQSEFIYNQERIPQQRADQESWQQRGMEGYAHRYLEKTWHMKKKYVSSIACFALACYFVEVTFAIKGSCKFVTSCLIEICIYLVTIMFI